MLASVHAKNTPAKPCQFDNNRSVCPEAWEMRQLYVIEATAKPLSWHQKIGSGGVLIPEARALHRFGRMVHHRVGSIRRGGKALEDDRDLQHLRRSPGARREGCDLSVQADVPDRAGRRRSCRTGFSSVVYMPGHESDEHESWYINMGIVTKAIPRSASDAELRALKERLRTESITRIRNSQTLAERPGKDFALTTAAATELSKTITESRFSNRTII